MPLIRVLNAATTLCDPGVSMAILGLVSVRCGVALVVVGCWTSVLFCESPGLLVAGDTVVRGRTVWEELVFCARAVDPPVKITSAITVNLMIIFGFLSQHKNLNVAQCIRGVEP